MYFDFNQRTFDKLGTTLHSSPFQHQATFEIEPGSGIFISPSSRLWRGLKQSGQATFEGKGLDKYYVMAKPSEIKDIRYFSVNPLRANPVHTATGNPFTTRLARLRDHYNNGFIGDSAQGVLIKPNIRPNEIRNMAKQIDPNLTEEQLDQVAQVAMAKRNGVHIPIQNDRGVVNGVSIVDIDEAINWLKQSGITPDPYHVGIISGHEVGHGVQVSPNARRLVEGFAEPDEFYTRAGQILDDAGVFETSQNPVSFGKFMQFIDDYLKRGNLDNGISALKQYMQNISSPIKRQQVMGAINRFSVGTGSAYLLNNSLNE